MNVIIFAGIILGVGLAWMGLRRRIAEQPVPIQIEDEEYYRR